MRGQKKGPVLRLALKGSLNLMVSKGPEETTHRNLNLHLSSQKLIPEVCQGFPAKTRVDTPIRREKSKFENSCEELTLFADRLGGVDGVGSNGVEVGLSSVSGLLDSFLNRLKRVASG